MSLSAIFGGPIGADMEMFLSPQKNKKTGHFYSGSNLKRLNARKDLEKWSSNEWMTFVQAKELGMKIKKGSKGTPILVLKRFTPKEQKENSEKKDSYTYKKTSTVFNLEQMEG